MKAFLTTAILTVAFATVVSAALGDSAATGHHHGRHTQAPCTVKAKRAVKAKRKHHRRRPTKRAGKCVGGTEREKGAHSRSGGDRYTSGTRSVASKGHNGARPSSAQHASHQHASHQSSRPKQTTVSAIPSTAATIAKVLSGTCENTELTPESGNLEAVAQATLCLVDQERARDGELPLRVNAELTRAAEGHSAEMVEDNYFAHVSPSGETPFQRIEASGYIPNSQVGYTLGENIAWGTLYLATPKAIVAAWIASPEHLANILNGTYTETGLGVAPSAPPSLAEGEPGAVYSQEFGVIEG